MLVSSRTLASLAFKYSTSGIINEDNLDLDIRESLCKDLPLLYALMCNLVGTICTALMK